MPKLLKAIEISWNVDFKAQILQTPESGVSTKKDLGKLK